MMRQVIHRRFTRAKKEDGGRQSSNWPDLLLIDGGLGQLSAVHEALDDLGLDDLAVVAISKGPDRHAGREQFHVRDKPSFTLPQDSAAMHFLQRLGIIHRLPLGRIGQGMRKLNLEVLDAVPGIGPKRKSLVGAFQKQRGQFQLLVSVIWKL